MRTVIKIGSVFHHLTVLEWAGKGHRGNMYLCVCVCGKKRTASTSELRSNSAKSCGCKNFVSGSHGNRKYDPKHASFRAKAANYISHAKKRGIEISIGHEEIVELLKGDCYYCGSKPSNTYNARSRNRVNKKNKVQYAFNNPEDHEVLYNGIDRIDNNSGYVIGNVVSCCKKCNTAKLDSSKNEFIDWVIRVYNHIKKNGI